MDKNSGKERAMKIVSVRQRVRARVESVKGQVGVSCSPLCSPSCSPMFWTVCFKQVQFFVRRI